MTNTGGEAGLRTRLTQIDGNNVIEISLQGLGNGRGYNFSNRDLRELSTLLSSNPNAFIDRAQRVIDILGADHRWSQQAQLLIDALNGTTEYVIVK